MHAAVKGALERFFLGPDGRPGGAGEVNIGAQGNETFGKALVLFVYKQRQSSQLLGIIYGEDAVQFIIPACVGRRCPPILREKDITKALPISLLSFDGDIADRLIAYVNKCVVLKTPGCYI
ncbi:MAG: hypothetical protein ACOYIF_05830 [Acetivibrionales bacterium]